MSETYNRIGIGYATRRHPDPRIAQRLRSHLAGMASVVNVGAGAGAYEPLDLPVTAVEPARAMIAQRRSYAPVVQARAEALPLPDGAADAVMAVLTLHHWTDVAGGLAECARVARRRLVILTWDPDSDGFWLVRDYLPTLLAHDRTIFPRMDELRRILGAITVEPVPIPADCHDGFLGAYWRRPAAYLDPHVRAGISSFALQPALVAQLDALRRDLASGAWMRTYGGLLSMHALDVGYRLVIASLAH